jgi:DNA (cytosine-5)-methyltransferase 1
MDKPRLLDLFCGAGGAAMGYYEAGFEVVGVDINPQPRYPFEFHQADALEYPLDGFDAIHASPPCQHYSNVTGRNRHNTRRYPNLVPPTLARLRGLSVPWVVENVRRAPLPSAVMLCGSSFGLDLERHRWFESNVPMLGPPCEHYWQTPRFRSLDSRRKDGALSRVVGVYGHLNYPGEFALRCRAMGIDWMTLEELSEAIPPAYTRFIGEQLLAHLQAAA